MNKVIAIGEIVWDCLPSGKQLGGAPLNFAFFAKELGAEVYLPPLKLCGDNAAMIGAQAYYEYLAGNTAGMELNAYATKSILGEAL